MKILVVEDEPSVSSFIKKGLEEEGHEAVQAYDGDLALRLYNQHDFDLVLLDVIVPGINGLELCKRIRGHGDGVPIIMLTALGGSDDVISGLDTGADDYLVKPFKFKELLARIRAISRRGDLQSSVSELQLADLTINLDSKVVSRAGKEIQLTAREFNLLKYLITNKGRVVSRVDILENVWDINFDMGTNVIDVYINYLRNKIDKGYSSKLIHTVVGMGYVMREQ